MTALLELHIRNFAIIDELRLAFHAGLNVLTGETGAGKSIIIDALGLLLGDRATAEMIRSGAERAEIDAVFTLSPAPDGTEEALTEIRALLETEGLDDPDAPNSLILGREVRLGGRNIARVNGRAVSLQILSDIAGQLVDIHGQGEHLNLLRPRTHLALIDRYAGLTEQRGQLAEQVRRLHSVRRELDRLRQDARTLAQRIDLLSFQADEITAARLIAGEDEELENERRRLGNAEALLQLAQTAGGLLNDGDGESPGVIDLFSQAVGRLERLARIDSSMTVSADLAQSLLEQLSDLAGEIQDYADNLEFNPERLAEVEERLQLLSNLKRKYGDKVEDVIAYGEKAQAELDEMSDWEVKTAALEADEEGLLRVIGRLGAALSAARAAAGEQMARQVEKELADLRMAHTRFGLSLEQTNAADGAYLPDGRRVSFDSNGVDRVEFLISANPGEPLKPLARVASGGETSRLMLALKSVLAHADATPMLIFDEIDQGIGGRVGSTVGEKLWRLTGQQGSHPQELRHQVICITHLPQLAAYGDLHLSVNKRVYESGGDLRTGTVVTTLDGDERLNELTQMLGATTRAGRQSVQDMLDEVVGVKGEGRKTSVHASPFQHAR
ncbi:MAG: DNA repair protein RecN [Chloroflexi bacterium]|nr:MAG: DNA repair protein RecN [Chloroflexota bacterium]